MHNDEPIFCANADRPRHPHQEIADLLAVALLRLRDKDSALNHLTTSDGVVAQMPVAADVGSGDERDELGSG